MPTQRPGLAPSGSSRARPSRFGKRALILHSAAAAPRPRRIAIARAAPPPAAFAAFAAVTGLAAAQGGYFPGAWGWASVPLLWAAAITLVMRTDIQLSTGERAFLLAVMAYTSWLAMSVSWSGAPAESILEVERSLVYVGGVFTAILLSRSCPTRYLLGALLAAIVLVAGFSLATRVVPDRVGVYDGSGVYRLAQPIGYWNGLALFAAMGALLALGFAARAQTLIFRAASAAALVLLLPTLYFTFGRGVWIALALGLLAAVAVDPGRLQFITTLLAVGPAAAAAVAIASQMSALTHAGRPLALAAHDGHRLAFAIALLAAVNAAVSVALGLLQRRVTVSVNIRYGFAFALTLVVVTAAAVTLVRYGGPIHIAKVAYTRFEAAPPPEGGDLNRRLRSLSGNGRAQLWRLAWADASSHPLLGAGAGTYERFYLAHQPPNIVRVRDAHSLYLETLAELGPAGLAILIGMLAAPFAFISRARRHPLTAGAVGAYVAYLAHTGIDWDWELPAVTLAALLSGTAILRAARRSTPAKPLSAPVRVGTVAFLILASVFAGIALIGNSALSQSNRAREHGDYATAATAAARARIVMPWSPRPWQALGREQLASGNSDAARRSFRRAIAIDAGDWELWYDLALATRGARRVRALQRAAALYPRSGLAPETSGGRSK